MRSEKLVRPISNHKPRKAGGKVGSDSHPFTSAYHGEAPKGRKLDMEMD